MTKFKKDDKINKKSILLFIFLFILVVVAIVVSGTITDYSKISLRTNNKEIFNVSDLVIDDLTYMSTENDVVKKYGKAKKEENTNINGYKYKILSYDGLKITLREYYDTYTISKVEITSNRYTISRKIKVGKRIVSTMKKFKIKSKKSNYLYGNYSSNSLTDKGNTKNIYYGKRSSNSVEYVNRDKVLENYDIPTNIAKLYIEYKFGRIKKIIWSYDMVGVE